MSLPLLFYLWLPPPQTLVQVLGLSASMVGKLVSQTNLGCNKTRIVHFVQEIVTPIFPHHSHQAFSSLQPDFCTCIYFLSIQLHFKWLQMGTDSGVHFPNQAKFVPVCGFRLCHWVWATSCQLRWENAAIFLWIRNKTTFMSEEAVSVVLCNHVLDLDTLCSFF